MRQALVAAVLICSCGSGEPRLDEKETAGKAAKAGAVGALGGLVYGLIARNPDALRTSAAAGAAAATVVAAQDTLSDTKGDKQKEQFEKRFGPDNANAIVQLVKRDYAGARASLDAAAKGAPEHARAAVWLRALLARDTGDAAAERAAIEDLLRNDPELKDADPVKGRIDQLQKKLADLRKEYGDG